MSARISSATSPSATIARNDCAVRLGEEDGARVALEQGRARARRSAPGPTPRSSVAEISRGHVGEGRHLVGPALGVAEQPGVLDRDADVGGERREQARVRVAEPALALHALDADHADRRVADDDRDARGTT